ncbi:granulysin isoform X1 [Callithrix jacchus]|uniref:Granulysin n=1 Tax=Callithrix jacchus TaxID=9483 RepID=A0A5F4W049_CALJA|nr:granulysin isoform X1 [Callithrix jacchus]
MATWALLLLAAMLLGNPGLVVSRQSPEYYDLATAHLGDKERSCPCLAQEGPQDDLFTKTEKLGFRCKTCLRMIQALKDMVKEPTKENISDASTRLCRKVKSLWRDFCLKTIRRYMPRLIQDIMGRKTAQEICVDIRMCKPSMGPL